MNYNKVHTTAEGLEVTYSIYKDKGDRYQPPATEVEIIHLEYDEVDVTDLLFEVASDYIDTLIEKLENEE